MRRVPLKDELLRLSVHLLSGFSRKHVFSILVVNEIAGSLSTAVKLSLYGFTVVSENADVEPPEV